MSPNIIPGKGVLNFLPSTTDGWNTGANSNQCLPAGKDGSLFFTLETIPSYVMIGLVETPDADSSYGKINYCIYFRMTDTLIYESNTNHGILGEGNELGTIYEIRRVGGVVTYYQNGNNIHESTVTSDTDLYIDCSTHSQGVF